VNDIPEKNRVMIINGTHENECDISDVKHLITGKISKTAFMLLHIESINAFIMRYSGKEDLFLNGQNIFPEQTCTFDHGSTIRGSWVLDTIYYSDISSSIFTEESI
jgi:hypothetical protein